jgi:uncharacterized OB-fold protein
MSEPAPIDLPAGLWSQPALDASAVAELADVESVQSLRAPASLHYDYTPGIATTRFLRALKEKKLTGEVCPESGKVYIPPRGVSPTSGLVTTELVELAHVGTMVGYCIVNLDFTGNAQEIPYVSALILLDGADVPVYGLVREIPYDEVRVGMRLEPVWVEDSELTTSFENIKWWKPNGEPDASYSDIADYV